MSDSRGRLAQRRPAVADVDVARATGACAPAIGLVALWLLSFAAAAQPPAPAPEVVPIVARVHAGAGVLFAGGAVGPPDLGAHARPLGLLAVELGARPFGGGAAIGLGFAAAAADGASIGTVAGLWLEYGFGYIADSSPSRSVDVALGGMLALSYAHTWATSAVSVSANYDLMRPDWRFYLELRVRAARHDHVVVRLQAANGFDLTSLTSLTLSAGYAYDGL